MGAKFGGLVMGLNIIVGVLNATEYTLKML